MIHITVTVDQEHIRVIGDVATVLRTKGMHVEQVLDSIGIITGSLPEDRRPELEAAEGVESVDEQQHFQLAPPDSDIQ
ncbi:hypothetical protein [Arthrobacter monumenti]